MLICVCSWHATSRHLAAAHVARGYGAARNANNANAGNDEYDGPRDDLRQSRTFDFEGDAPEVRGEVDVALTHAGRGCASARVLHPSVEENQGGVLWGTLCAFAREGESALFCVSSAFLNEGGLSNF